MSQRYQISKAIRSTLVLWLLTAFIYPLFMLISGQIAFSNQVNGSLITNSQGTVIGSALIGQPFTSENYFWSRPSTTNYSTANPKNDDAGILKTGVSGASNLAPSNPELLKRINGTDGEINRLKKAGVKPTADLVYTSGSSLDPHITPEGAEVQIARVAKARGVQPQKLKTLILQNTDGRFLGIFGEPGVNVFKLNLALDKLS
ncbi:K(+)-transporting ATPase subunit C [Anabaena cylindrica FACHB-243]|uniref:Potassium-transporting ATPase KdpC subunit n=1 Tax=Anabaena cylindrica (strain ATCC 27899 / PCC 7122) TaxID=272123 RepID=K9ZK75_ANACC|nr:MULTISPECIES: K(+)-transporting ATPase subunit C [Anabaena]AFZ58705.1 Potassium-transporting ATPase C chain [Anabaena cylindrica PCC 7122]MBD2420048.1 K(+)-transporting ATPase subunit C [Anabaena cylindrica FACHB-243]MBY5282981.1 K(+)-transporting ATPase subunit C [Anabaena sp. CCAP 1446/1C]MBY5306520.1 K(+)-transporting ATPase subunit C [Anabaena sp. CCAP 1446/1C]MCM2407056.1 K(+)-transporting ATPase subunit C [Anabaena sp. CCAP 1446/1C]